MGLGLSMMVLYCKIDLYFAILSIKNYLKSRSLDSIQFQFKSFLRINMT